MQTVLVTFGTRPEAIKMAPVVTALKARPEDFRTVVCVTAQHRGLLDQVLERFGITPDVDLDLMRPGQGLPELTARVLTAMSETIRETEADHVLVQGDTTTAMAGGLAAFYARVPVSHIEAGLRSGRMDAPFPEEMNRVVLDAFCDHLFPPTPGAAAHLEAAGLPAERSLVTGNTSIDALLWLRERLASFDLPVRDRFDGAERLALITCHRRESFGAPLLEVLGALQTLASEHPDVTFVYPVHPNPNVRGPAEKHLTAPNLHLLDPVDYADLVWLLDKAELVLSDSGGLQEEAPTIGRPILVLRDVTERPELVEAGAGILVGTDRERILDNARRLLADPAGTPEMRQARNLFGDGRAGERIAATLAGDSPDAWVPEALGTLA